MYLCLLLKTDLYALESERTLQDWKTANLVLRYILVMGNSTEHEISNAHKNLINKTDLFCSKHILLINIIMSTIVGILTFMGRINSVLNRFEHETVFICSIKVIF